MGDTTFSKKPMALGAPDAGSGATGEGGTAFVRKPKLTAGRSRKRDIPSGLWTKCPKCETMVFDKELDENLKVCPKCQHHFPIGARERIHSLVETCTFEEMDADMTSVDALQFTGVAVLRSQAPRTYQKSTGLKDAVITGIGKIGEFTVSPRRHGLQLPRRLDGLRGRRKTHPPDRSAPLERELPVIIISTSGGARMYEGMFSLMQLAKTCAALAYHAKAKLPYISILTHPTTAGVMASYASVGDLILAEPGAMIGFAGPRVIKDTTQAELPPGFQTAEFLLDHGLIDAIVLPQGNEGPPHRLPRRPPRRPPQSVNRPLSAARCMLGAIAKC
jgi:acetyl-CoA carboxylase carboxyl transferase subunit beta